MQAGDRLAFIRPFNETTEQRELKRDVLSDEMTLFIKICNQLLQRFYDTIETREVLEQIGFVTAFELSLSVPCSDDSYLHVLVFGHSQGDDLLEIGISVIEHEAEGKFMGGYMYLIDPEELGVFRSTVGRSDADRDEDPAIQNLHFSILDTYSEKDHLIELELSDDDEDRREAQKVRDELDREIELARMEKDLGYDNLPVDSLELEQLALLLEGATAFPLPYEDSPSGDIY